MVSSRPDRMETTRIRAGSTGADDMVVANSGERDLIRTQTLDHLCLIFAIMHLNCAIEHGKDFAAMIDVLNGAIEVLSLLCRKRKSRTRRSSLGNMQPSPVRYAASDRIARVNPPSPARVMTV